MAETRDDHPLPELVHSWKSYTAKRANALLRRSGASRTRDYFDRYIRDDSHLAAVIAYIENNPAKAGLVTRREDWPFRSAARRERT